MGFYQEKRCVHECSGGLQVSTEVMVEVKEQSAWPLLAAGRSGRAVFRLMDYNTLGRASSTDKVGEVLCQFVKPC